MRKILVFAGALTIFMAACSSQAENSAPKVKTTVAAQNIVTVQNTQITFKAVDGETVYGDLHMATQNEAAPLIILFHQAGSNGRGEYASIIPKLKAKGYSLLVVDQRSGGGHYGSENRTVKARGSKTKYCAAYPDMEGALAYAKTKSNGSSIFAWGSSYSAALVLKLASEHGQDLAGVLSFSPATGKAMGECNANNFISAVNIPALGLRPDSEMKSGAAQKQMYLAQGLEYFVAQDGVHGSSMLDPARAKGDTTPTWKAVLAFLNKHK